MRILDCQAWDKVSDITEVWKPIEGYEDKYLISNTGKVKSLYRNIILKPKTDKDGYKEVSLHKNGKSKTKKIHRLVAYAFIPNPNNLLQVNHKDEIKANNNVSNLEWCTIKYNHNYGTIGERTGKKLRKRVFAFNMNLEFVSEYKTAIHAAKELGIAHGGITDCCNRKLRTFHKFIWRYSNEDIRLSELEQN